jgi:nitrate reductase gamma subunit
MSQTLPFQILAGLALLFAILAFGLRLRWYNALPRPTDRAAPKGSVKAGLVYAYTLGMAPWSKESTRLHRAAYLRGVIFHLGIFLCLGLLLISPWFSVLPSTIRLLLALGAASGAVCGLTGFFARFVEQDLKALSLPDDYFAVLLVSLFLAASSLALVTPSALPVLYLVSAAMLIYAPFGKIRHCIYFAYSRLFYGRFIGSRGILPHGQGRKTLMEAEGK